MLKRNSVIMAAVLGLAAWSAAPASAQERGRDRAAVASAQAEAVGAGERGRAVGRPSELPPGIAKKFPERPLPPGIERTREAPSAPPPPEPEPEPQPQPEPPPEECQWNLVFADGGWWLENSCNGDRVPVMD